MAATNKSLAQISKAGAGVRATNDTNGLDRRNSREAGRGPACVGRFARLLPLKWMNSTRSEGRLVGMLPPGRG